MQNVKRDEPLKFAVILDIKPELKVKDYKGLKFKKKEAAVKDEEVEETLVKVLSRQGSLEEMPADYAVQDEDILTLDFDGTRGSVTFSGATGPMPRLFISGTITARKKAPE